MLRNYVIPEQQQRNDSSDIVWMQYGTPSPICQYFSPELQQYFGDGVILQFHGHHHPQISNRWISGSKVI